MFPIIVPWSYLAYDYLQPGHPDCLMAKRDDDCYAAGRRLGAANTTLLWDLRTKAEVGTRIIFAHR